MEEKFEELSGNIKDGFSSHGELLTGLMQQESRGKRFRQKSRSSSSDSVDGDQTTSPKRARLKDEQNDDVAVLLGESQPQGEKSLAKFWTVLSKSWTKNRQLGPDVSEKLAGQVINKTLRSKLSERKLKEKQNAYSRPQNCESLETTRVNPEIWAQLQLLLKGLLPLVQLLENCQQSDDRSTNKRKIIKLVLDSVSLVAQANVELNSRRRALIKPDLDEKFQKICGDHVPITTLLFGDDVVKTLQDIASTNRVTQKVATPSRRPSYATKITIIGIQKMDGGGSGPKTTSTSQKGPKPLQTTESVKLDKQLVPYIHLMMILYHPSKLVG